MLVKGIALVLVALALAVSAAPQGETTKEPLTPYDFKYEVKDEPSKSYYGQEEERKDNGRTEGKYYVWLADGRLLTVTYYVEGSSGFVAKSSYSDNYKPTFTNTRK